MRIRALAAAVLCGVAASLFWGLGVEQGGAQPGTAVLGLFRDRFFLLAAGTSWLALLFAALAAFGQRAGFLGRLALLHLGLGAAVVVLELAALVGLVDYEALFRLRATANPLAREHGLSRMGFPNAHYEGRARPDLVELLGVDAPAIPYVLDTDRYGLRNRDSEVPPRVVCLGDSVLVGGLLAAQDLVSERLSRELGLPVLNVAEVGFAPQEALRRFETTGLAPAGKLFLQFVFEGNDVSDSARWRSRDEAFSRDRWPWNGFVKSGLRLLHRPLRGAALRRAGVCRTAVGREEPVWFLYDATQLVAALPELERLGQDLVAARDDLEARGGRYALVLVPSKLSALAPVCRWPEGSELAAAVRVASPLPSHLEALAREHGIPFLDLTPHFREAAARSSSPFFAADTHPNELGHAVMATAVAEFARPLLAP